jgi:maltose alpha-D-glucosyltransferase/alpha-amylase
MIKSVGKHILIIALLALASCRHDPPPAKNIDAWYKHLLIYNLDVKTFQDSDGDGEGDFNGLTEKLPYLQSLGINTIWLAPFQPSPLKDDGYDIIDYLGTDPKLGGLAGFKKFMAAAKANRIKVIMDVILNHTSDEHPWFKAAIRDTNSPKHNWYVWSAKRPADWDKGIGFPGVEKETWRYEPTAREYYFHRFYNFQPDLNYQNPEVIAEAKRILAYWLDQGIDGFRLDAVPFTIDDPRKDSEKPKFDFGILHRLSLFVKKHKPGAVLLGEANVEPKENQKYFGKNHNGLEMMFNFYANQYLFHSLATADVKPFKEALNKTKAKPGTAQWTWFLRNHDEIDLGRLSKSDLNDVYKKMAPVASMQLYKRGIRRRLAPMLNGNMQQLKMAYSLLYSLPGTPVIRSGEEIGMGEDLSLKERLAIRTPMQWDTTANAGFTTGKPFRPVINAGIFGYKTVNVTSEKRDERSLLNFIQQIIKLRKAYPEIDNGEWSVINEGQKAVLVIKYNDKGKTIIVAHNFSEHPQEVIFPNNHVLKLDGYGFKWLRLN